MSLFRRPASPVAGFRDLRDFVLAKGEHRWLFAGISIALAALFFVLLAKQFTKQSVYKEAEVTYVTQWPNSRSVEDVRAQQAKDAPAERAARQRAEAEAEKRREQFRKAGKALESIGMGSMEPRR